MADEIRTRCCIAGGGPAGMMAGFLLARAGVDVVVLEKYPDLFRDFRGDTIHPSTLQVLSELSLVDDFLKLPHSELRQLSGEVNGQSVKLADLSHLRWPFIVLVPQWDFLNFLAARGKAFPTFRVLMKTEATDLVTENGRVVGVEAKGPDGALTIRAELVIAADGRHSTLRKAAGLEIVDLGAPMDVLWFRISRKGTDPETLFGHLDRGRFAITLDRGEYWQCGYVIAKGETEKLKAQGLEEFRRQLAQLLPFLADRVEEISGWDQVKLLTVAVDHLVTWWKPGLLCIGDSAHAMSPVGGVGINLAIQDAVATARILGPRFLKGTVTDADLAAVEKRRLFPTQMTQRLQILVQNGMIKKILAGEGPLRPPLPMRLLDRFAFLRRIPARVVGMGFRPEHIAPDQRAGGPRSGAKA
jgi:2-polyprenyl-6-methoxyphenol hydroxylase-like FAD-dependent oxidoreductase